MAEAAAPLLLLDAVRKEFGVRKGVLQRTVASVKAVSDVSFEVAARARRSGLVGESGCGKTTVGRLIVALEQPDPGASGFDGTDLDALPARRCAGRAATCS